MRLVCGLMLLLVLPTTILLLPTLFVGAGISIFFSSSSPAFSFWSRPQQVKRVSLFLLSQPSVHSLPPAVQRPSRCQGCDVDPYVNSDSPRPHCNNEADNSCCCLGRRKAGRRLGLTSSTTNLPASGFGDAFRAASGCV
jgi:hypothetical protein